MELGKNNNQVPTEQALHITNVMLSLPDIRNKLSPIKNLIAMLENGLVKGNVFGLCVRCLCALARVSESNDAKPVLYEGGISRTTLS